MTRLAVAASAAFPDLGLDWPLLRHALARKGITAATQVWNDPAADWDLPDLVLANGAWDYIHHPEEFLAWADGVARRTPMVNGPHTLRWNLDKRYLAALAGAGVPTVPTSWVEPGAGPDTIALPPGEFVVKPSISGGGFQTARYGDTPAEHADARTHLGALLAAGSTAMVQPYQQAVDTEGETGLIFLGGEYSHAIHKSPLLPTGTRPAAHLLDNQKITATEAGAAQRTMAEHALQVAERLLGPSTYARVDLVTGADGSEVLLELELLDPALFFDHHPPAADRFASVLLACLASA